VETNDASTGEAGDKKGIPVELGRKKKHTHHSPDAEGSGKKIERRRGFSVFQESKCFAE